MEIQKKIPKQARSIALVNSILKSATKLLLLKGMKELTTNHIATHADINIASLYQYFPNKEAIVAKLIELHVEEEIERISTVMANISENSQLTNKKILTEENIRLIIMEFIDVHRENLKLTQILHSQVSHVACRQALRNATRFFSTLIENMLDSEEFYKNEDNSVRAYVITNSIDSLIQTTLIEQPDLFIKPIFLDELVYLCMGYLQS